MTGGDQQPVCIVLGAGGFIGSTVVAEAQRRGFRTLGVTRQNYETHKGTACALLVNANGNSKKFLARENPPLDFDLSVRSVHQSLHDFPADTYVHLSTIDVYSEVMDPAKNHENAPIDTARLSPYGFHKLLAEQLVRHYAKRWLILRMGGFVGPGLRKNSIYDLLKGAQLRVHPDSSYQYLDSRFLASLAFDLPQRGLAGETINCAGSGLISVREIAALIPGAALPPMPAGQPERYEVNTAKLRALVPVPSTRDTVSAFVARVLAGQEQLA